MENLLPTLRNTARALIVRDHCILLLRKDGYEEGERFALPGGAQNPGETLEQALKRECEEEIAVQVQITELVHVAEYYKLRNAEPPNTRHLIEFLFTCTIPDDYTPKNGHHPDKHQVEVVWRAINELEQIPFYPKQFVPYLKRIKNPKRTVYLGAIN